MHRRIRPFSPSDPETPRLARPEVVGVAVGLALLMAGASSAMAMPESAAPSPALPGTNATPVAASPKADTPAHPITSPTGRKLGVPTVRGLFGMDFPAGRIGTGPDGKTSSIFGPLLKLSLDLGAQVAPHWRLSGRLDGYMGATGNNFDAICNAGQRATQQDASSSSNSDNPTSDQTCMSFGFGVDAVVRYDFKAGLGGSSADPWLSFGVGYELLHAWGSTGSSQAMNGEFDGSASGLNFAMPSLGIDWVVNGFLIGPYVSATLGQNLTRSAKMTVNDVTVPANMGGSATYYWFGAGLHGGV